LSTAARTFLNPYSISNSHISNLSHNRGVKLSQVLSRIMLAIHCLIRKGILKVIVFGYINFASDLDRTWDVQECSMCVRTASSFAMIAYIYIYIN
jgi:hypothetical protein